jgi:NAD(P) transhydrogenase subunit alpha
MRRAGGGDSTAGPREAGPPRPDRGRRAAPRTVEFQEERMSHYAQLVVELTILALAIFLGLEVISKVPTLLHTPLMSGTNAIHGIVIVGAILIAGTANPGTLVSWIGFLAMILATANVVGGFVVTDRMLEMFKRREPRKGEGDRTRKER